MYGALDISTSGMVAQRVRLSTISANLAQRDAILNADGDYEPYRRRIPVFAAGDPASADGLGVHVAGIIEDDAPLRMKYEPESPWADASGYVHYPNVDPVIEQMNAMEALRAYEANVSAAETTKSMVAAALRMLA
ncbi:MAG: flagellar basal body rod protein FlgC [Phycisphaeraceae bacterium]|nr:flagellar basal body rod protein FlgC [Phycisphaeraceae bacterium]